MQRQHGLTLIEIMVTISILTIVMTFVIPSTQSLLLQQRIIASLNTTSASLQFAKSHAVTNMTDVSICPTTDYVVCVKDWGQAKMVFVIQIVIIKETQQKYYYKLYLSRPMASL